MPGHLPYDPRFRAVTLLADTHVNQLFMESNIEPHQRDVNARLLQELLGTLGLQPSDLRAVSRGEYDLYFVGTSLIAVAGTKGIFSKPVEVRHALPIDQVVELSISEEGYKDKREYILVLAGEAPASNVRLTWTGWLGEFGGIPAASAEAERDRVYKLVNATAR
jgi:hypothetical protein